MEKLDKFYIRYLVTIIGGALALGAISAKMTNVSYEFGKRRASKT